MQLLTMRQLLIFIAYCKITFIILFRINPHDFGRRPYGQFELASHNFTHGRQLVHLLHRGSSDYRAPLLFCPRLGL